MITADRYTADMAKEWNEFVDHSRNATFLLRRDFMDYHSDRFRDSSLMIRDGRRLLALLPANITETADEGRVLHSHQGLTYGGLLLPQRHCGAADVLHIMEAVADYCKAHEISALDYKPIPYIYASRPSQEDLYALWRLGALRSGCNLSVTIDLATNPGFDTQQRRNLKRASGSEACVRKIGGDEEIRDFHAMLAGCLSERHDAAPVHSADELILLHSRFPDKISFYVTEADGEMQAGVCLFDCGTTLHSQYICSTPKARSEGLLTMLFDSVIEQAVRSQTRYFDFGTCNEAGGRYLNEGLARQKYGLGGSAVVYERYELPI